MNGFALEIKGVLKAASEASGGEQGQVKHRNQPNKEQRCRDVGIKPGALCAQHTPVPAGLPLP